jgi:hypothetical protein
MKYDWLDDSYVDASLLNDSLESLNKSLIDQGESPVDKKRCRYKKYSYEKSEKIHSAVKRKLLNADFSENEDDSTDDVVNHLLNAYQNCKSSTKKIMLVTLLPDIWSIRKIANKFKAPNYQVRQAKKLLMQNGILSTPNRRPGKKLAHRNC